MNEGRRMKIGEKQMASNGIWKAKVTRFYDSFALEDKDKKFTSDF